MTTEHAPTGLIGASIRRVEDPVLVAGRGCYVDDIRLPGMSYLAFLRTTYPHAKIISINTSAAKAMAGVIAVLTGADVELMIPVPPMIAGQKIPPIRFWRAARCMKPAWPWRQSSRRAATDCRGRCQRHRGGIRSAAIGNRRGESSRARRAAGSRGAGQQHLLHRDEKGWRRG